MVAAEPLALSTQAVPYGAALVSARSRQRSLKWGVLVAAALVICVGCIALLALTQDDVARPVALEQQDVHKEIEGLQKEITTLKASQKHLVAQVAAGIKSVILKHLSEDVTQAVEKDLAKAKAGSSLRLAAKAAPAPAHKAQTIKAQLSAVKPKAAAAKAKVGAKAHSSVKTKGHASSGDAMKKAAQELIKARQLEADIKAHPRAALANEEKIQVAKAQNRPEAKDSQAKMAVGAPMDVH